MDYKKIQNGTVRLYLELVEDTEPPRLMHIWSCIASASAAMGRHTWYDLGIEPIYGNMYILLVGPPGCRKNTAINLADKLLGETNVRYSPDDTGGQRQGLLTALINQTEKSTPMEDMMQQQEDILSGKVPIDLTPGAPATVDMHTLHIKASEFGSFMGQNNMELARFLVKMWDGDDYHYMLKNSSQRVTNPLLSMIGGTTPTDIALILPQEAMGQGFMSRVILCFASKKYQHISRPRPLPETQKQWFKDRFKWIWYEAHGQIKENRPAQLALDSLYQNRIRIDDTRFLHYLERRHTHLIKTSMALAVLRKSMVITETDVNDAHFILTETELTMPDALGHYGLSAESVARQRMIEFLRASAGPVPRQALWAMMIRDMKLIDFEAALVTFANSNQISETIVKGIGRCYSIREDRLEEQSIRNLLAAD